MSAALCLLFAAGCAQLPPSGGADPVAALPYDYPFDNPWTATVLGTPEALRVASSRRMPEFDHRTLTVFEVQGGA